MRRPSLKSLDFWIDWATANFGSPPLSSFPRFSSCPEPSCFSLLSNNPKNPKTPSNHSVLGDSVGTVIGALFNSFDSFSFPRPTDWIEGNFLYPKA